MQNFNIRKKYQQFRVWQQNPYEVAPLTDETHECATCHTRFVGNFCPRCGQSAKIGRYSFKNAFLMFLDVWGLGNRSMFRTLRDLLFRPGYMIRDYLKGMQMAYYPPFKMFFLLTALSLLVTHGMNIEGRNLIEEMQTSMQAGFEKALQKTEEDIGVDTPSETNYDQALYNESYARLWTNVMHLQEAYPNLFSLASLLVISVFFYLFFRKSPAIPDLRYSELVVALVYLSNMLSIYSVICDFFCLHDNIELLTYLLIVPAMKQLFGFSWLRTIWRLLASCLLMLALVFVCEVIAGVIAYWVAIPA